MMGDDEVIKKVADQIKGLNLGETMSECVRKLQ